MGNVVIGEEYFAELRKSIGAAPTAGTLPDATVVGAPKAGAGAPHQHEIEAPSTEQFDKLLKGMEGVSGNVTTLMSLLDPGSEEDQREPGALIKMLKSLKDDSGTHAEALEQIINRVEAIENRSNPRRSIEGQDGDGEKGKVNKSTGGTDFDDMMRYIARNPGKQLVLR